MTGCATGCRVAAGYGSGWRPRLLLCSVTTGMPRACRSAHVDLLGAKPGLFSEMLRGHESAFAPVAVESPAYAIAASPAPALVHRSFFRNPECCFGHERLRSNLERYPQAGQGLQSFVTKQAAERFVVALTHRTQSKKGIAQVWVATC